MVIWEEKREIRAVFKHQKSYIKKGEDISIFLQRDNIGPNGGHFEKDDLGSQLGSIFFFCLFFLFLILT